jgi:hypothetical protein
MLVNPRVQVKTIEGNTFFPYGNGDEPWTNIAIEHPPPDTAIGGCIAIADQAWLRRDGHGASTIA